MTWDEYFTEVCITASKKSKDPSTKVGAAIVGPDHELRSTGWNGFPRGVKDLPERYNDRELKYKLVAHGELNAICNANRSGTILKDCTLYVYPFFPCNECAKAIIQVGIKELVIISEKPPVNWEEKVAIAKLLFDEAGVSYRFIDISGGVAKQEEKKEIKFVPVDIDGMIIHVPEEVEGTYLYQWMRQFPDSDENMILYKISDLLIGEVLLPDSKEIIKFKEYDRLRRGFLKKR